MSRRGALRALSLLALLPMLRPADAQDKRRELMDSGKETLGKAAPELISAGWVGSPLTLRGVKGNTVVLNFWNRNKGWSWSSGPDKDKLVHHTNIEESQKASPGILDRKTIPVDAGPLAHLYDLQQFQLLELEMKKIDGRKPNDEMKEFISYLRG